MPLTPEESKDLAGKTLAVLREYGDHGARCRKRSENQWGQPVFYPTAPCTCGFDPLKRALEESSR